MRGFSSRKRGESDPRFAFTDPPFRHSLPMVLAFAATGDRPTAVLTGPAVIAGSRPGLIRAASTTCSPSSPCRAP